MAKHAERSNVPRDPQSSSRDADQPRSGETISNRAYERFVERGSEHGHDVEDWLEAERELGVTRGDRAGELGE